MTASGTGTDEIASFRYRYSSTVRFGDIDVRNHMNNVAILRTLETARVEYLFEVGIGDPLSYELVVASLAVDFTSSARYRDELLCGVRTGRIGNSSLVLVQQLWRRDEPPVATAEVTLVHRTGDPRRPTRIPDAWREFIARWEPELVPGTEASAP